MATPAQNTAQPGPEDVTSQQVIEQLMSEGGDTAIIDFWSETCVPCKSMAPAYKAVAEAFAEEPIRFLKINTGRHPHLARPFNIRAVPTMLFVHNGEIVDVRVGVLDETGLVKKAKWLLSKAKGESFLKRIFL